MRAGLILVLLIPLVSDSPVRADDEAATPLIFFRKPDKSTEKWIEGDLISGNGLGAGTRDQRALARAKLIVLDAWAVPYLAGALYGRDAPKAHTIRMNAAATLARILDPRALPALRGAAQKDKDAWVRRLSILTLGLYRLADDINFLNDVLDRSAKRERDPAAALALGKIPRPESAHRLLARLTKPPQDEHLTSGILLAAAVRSPDVPVGEFLEHKKKVVRRIAAACLLIRPPDTETLEQLLKLADRKGDREVRALQYYALGLIPARTKEIREALLDCAVKTKHKTEVRVAALVGLADEWNEHANFQRLHNHYRSIQGRNDPVVAAFFPAMVHTGDPKAVDICKRVLKSGSPFLRFYATAALFQAIALGPDKHAEAGIITDAILAQRPHTQNPQLLKLIDLVLRWSSPPEGITDVRRLAREGLAALGDPRNLHLFDRTREERAWALLNSMLPYIFELDDVAVDLERHDTSTPPRAEPGSNKKDEGGSEEELDLIDFLREKPYFVPADLGGPEEIR